MCAHACVFSVHRLCASVSALCVREHVCMHARALLCVHAHVCSAHTCVPSVCVVVCALLECMCGVHSCVCMCVRVCVLGVLLR